MPAKRSKSLGPIKSASRARGQNGESGAVVLYGIHAVEAALANPRRTIGRVFLTENSERRLAEALIARGIRAERVLPRELDRRLGTDTVHQGALLETEPLALSALEDLAQATPAGPIVVLDKVTDPHNVGAVLRSAAAFGAAGLVMTFRHSPPLSGALAKSASGALDLIPIALVQNLARALAQLKALGCRSVGLEGGAEHLIEDEPLTGPLVLVLGAEGKGLRQLTRETCDRLCRITTPGVLSSLNVSNAAAVALHLCAMRRMGR
jgi:23S rRNA (guanosine2251-2'-O)-methyltransferase